MLVDPYWNMIEVIAICVLAASSGLKLALNTSTAHETAQVCTIPRDIYIDDVDDLRAEPLIAVVRQSQLLFVCL